MEKIASFELRQPYKCAIENIITNIWLLVIASCALDVICGGLVTTVHHIDDDIHSLNSRLTDGHMIFFFFSNFKFIFQVKFSERETDMRHMQSISFDVNFLFYFFIGDKLKNDSFM